MFLWRGGDRQNRVDTGGLENYQPTSGGRRTGYSGYLSTEPIGLGTSGLAVPQQEAGMVVEAAAPNIPAPDIL